MLKILTTLFWLVTAFSYAQIPWQNPGRIYISTNDGLSWRRADDGFPQNGDVNTWVEKDKLIYAGTEKHGIFIYSYRAKHWISSSFGLPADAKIDALAVAGNKLVAGTYRHGIYTSDDNGQHWIASNRGLSNKTIKDLHILNDVIFAGTNNGIYVSDDGGNQWRAMAGGFQVNIFAYQDKTIFAATNKGLLKSSDAGKTWSTIYDKHAVLYLTTDGESLYMKAHNQGILKSTDMAQTWIKANDGLPLTYMAKVIPVKEKLLVAKALGIYESNDKGKSWKLTGAGLIKNASFANLLNSSVGVFAAAAPITEKKPGSGCELKKPSLEELYFCGNFRGTRTLIHCLSENFAPPIKLHKDPS